MFNLKQLLLVKPSPELNIFDLEHCLTPFYLPYMTKSPVNKILGNIRRKGENVAEKR